MMSSKRARQIEDGLTGISRKVFEAVPKSDAWATSTIVGEMKRVAGGGTYDLSMVTGCLEGLKNSGLVREPKRGTWIRSPVREVEPADGFGDGALLSDEPTPARAPARPLDRLAAVAAHLRDLANDIEDIAIEIEQESQQATAQTAKLRQLQDLLRGL